MRRAAGGGAGARPKRRTPVNSSWPRLSGGPLEIRRWSPAWRACWTSLGVPTSLQQVGIDIDGLDAVVDHIIEEAPQLGSRTELRGLCSQLW